MERVVLLNSDYSFLNVIDWKRALCLLAKGKVEIVALTDKIIKAFDGAWEIIIPKVVRLVKLVRSVYKSKVPFTKKNVFIRDRYTCQYCGSHEDLTIDHVVPSSRGGKTDFENCVTSCKKCNNRKDNKTPKEAKMSLARSPYQPTIMEFIQLRIRTLGVDDLLKELAGVSTNS